MRRFYIEFLLTTLVFAHIFFGVIYFRARGKLHREEALAIESNRKLLGMADTTTTPRITSGESGETRPVAGDMPVEEIFERITDARKNNNQAALEREIARLVAAGARAIPALQKRFNAGVSDAEKIIIALALARICRLTGTDLDEFFEKYVFPFLESVFERMTGYYDIDRIFQAAAAYGTDKALEWIAGRFTSTERGDVKNAALRALVEAENDVAEDLLFDLLENAVDFTDRRRVMGVFLENPNPEHIERIREMLEKEPPPSAATRILLAGLLGAIYQQAAGGDETDFEAFCNREVPFLTDILNSSRTGMLRRDALKSLISIWNEEAQAVVSQVLSDEKQNFVLRVLAGKALASHGHVGALEPLQKMMDSDHPRAKVGAAEAIVILRNETGDPNVEAVLDEEVVPVVKAMLLKRETAYIRNAANVLAAVGSIKARDALIEIINNAPARHSKMQSIRALGSYADEETAAALEDYLDNENLSSTLREAASETLTRIKNELKRKNP